MVVLACRLHASTTIVAAHDNVFYLKYRDGILNYAQTIEIRMHDNIRNIAVDKDLAWRNAHDLISRHATVRTSDPEELGRLLFRQTRKKIGV